MSDGIRAEQGVDAVGKNRPTLHGRQRAATIHDVARRSQVGIGTVSRVLNDSPRVKDATRQRVRAAIEDLGYSPNLIARSLRSRQTGSIGVIVPYFTRPFFSEVLQGVEAMLAQAGRAFVLYNVQNREQYDTYFRQLLRQGKIDGLLIVSLSPDDALVADFQDAGFPVVLVDAYHPQLTSLMVNNVEGAYQAARCLIEHGHRRIGFIYGKNEDGFRFNPNTDRFIGLHRALGEVGLRHEPDLALSAEWNRQGGRQAALELLSRPDRPTAIFATSDEQAVGVLEAVRSLQLSVPGDLSVVGFDGIELAEILELSTVQQPMKYMGKLGVQKLIEQIEGSVTPAELVCLQPSLIVRGTIGAPPALSRATSR